MLEVGQILSLKIRFNNNGDISDFRHPYLIVNISEGTVNIVEIAQLDKLRGKEYKSLMKCNKVIRKGKETVIDEDSFIQKDNQFLLEYFPDLENCRRQIDKLSEGVLNDVINEYYEYHNTHFLDENKCVYMDESEIRMLNSDRL